MLKYITIQLYTWIEIKNEEVLYLQIEKYHQVMSLSGVKKNPVMQNNACTMNHLDKNSYFLEHEYKLPEIIMIY